MDVLNAKSIFAAASVWKLQKTAPETVKCKMTFCEITSCKCENNNTEMSLAIFCPRLVTTTLMLHLQAVVVMPERHLKRSLEIQINPTLHAHMHAKCIYSNFEPNKNKWIFFGPTHTVLSLYSWGHSNVWLWVSTLTINANTNECVGWSESCTL